MKEINKKIYELAGEEVPVEIDQILANSYIEGSTGKFDEKTKEIALKEVSLKVEDIYGKKKPAKPLSLKGAPRSSQKVSSGQKNKRVAPVNKFSQNTPKKNKFLMPLLFLMIMGILLYFLKENYL